MPLHNKHSFRCRENQTVECGSGFKRKYLMTDRRIRPMKCAERGLAYPILPSPPPFNKCWAFHPSKFCTRFRNRSSFGSVTIYSCSAIVQGGGGGGGDGTGGFVYIDRQRLAQVQRGFVLVLHLFTLSSHQQAGQTPFNRAMLFNIGFQESLKFDQYDCFIFHDVDLIPEDDRNEYSCPSSPRHMSVAVDKFNYRQVFELNFPVIIIH